MILWLTEDQQKSEKKEVGNTSIYTINKKEQSVRFRQNITVESGY